MNRPYEKLEDWELDEKMVNAGEGFRISKNQEGINICVDIFCKIVREKCDRAEKSYQGATL